MWDKGNCSIDLSCFGFTRLNVKGDNGAATLEANVTDTVGKMNTKCFCNDNLEDPKRMKVLTACAQKIAQQPIVAF